MALFPREDILPQEEAIRDRSITRESGTRTLVIGFVAILIVWFVSARVWDMYLLRKVWPALGPDEAGLSVVSTLDKRGSYDRNLFQVVQSEGSARAEITNFGWQAIFSGQHGALSADQIGSAIRNAINLDSQTGYAMLVPFLAAEVRSETGDRTAYAKLSGNYSIETDLPMTAQEKLRKHIPSRPKTLSELLDYFQQEGHTGKAETSDVPSEGASGSEHQVEHGLVIPGEILVRTCPVVMIGENFAGGSVEEHPEPVMGGKTYSVWLSLTPEGRSRFYQWSHNHVNEHLLLVLNREVVANGRIAMTMDTDKWEITNLKDGLAAKRLVDYINSRHTAVR